MNFEKNGSCDQKILLLKYFKVHILSFISTLEKEPYRRTGKWKSGWRTYPLFIIILGGFRWDYLESFQNLTAFAYLRKHGTSIPHVR